MGKLTPEGLSRIGLVLGMGSALILGFQPMETLWGTGMRAKFPLLNLAGWTLLFLSFGCQFVASYHEKS